MAINQKQLDEQVKFVHDLHMEVSGDLSAWVKQKFAEGWIMDDVRRAIILAAEIVGKE